MKNHAQILMVVCLLKLLSWSSPVNSQQLTSLPIGRQVISDQLPTNNSPIQNPLPCLDSSKECVERLTQSAVSAKLSAFGSAHSPKLKKLEERIALIDERLELMGDRKDYAESRLWTNYLPTSGVGSSVFDVINPFAWIKSAIRSVETE